MKTKHKSDILVRNKALFKCNEEHIITKCKITTDIARDLEERITVIALRRANAIRLGDASENLLKALHDEFTYYKNKLERLYKVDESFVTNITTTVGRSVIAQRLANTTTYTGVINYCALGDGNTAAAESDTTLDNEVYRKAISSGTYLNNVAYLETFFTAAEVADTFEEFGYYIDGTGSADTGQLFNRFLDTKVKSSIETLNVYSQITVSDA